MNGFISTRFPVFQLMLLSFGVMKSKARVEFNGDISRPFIAEAGSFVMYF